ncbi:hypothetical protein U9M48_033135 [Paspalum notatum var. saurae]|uniref:Uncharacterized protein n=1 Tax=Paspalum notatum var. saurae TaxID=547442 RepID=A0AAQ3X5Q9_PASNO
MQRVDSMNRYYEALQKQQFEEKVDGITESNAMYIGSKGPRNQKKQIEQMKKHMSHLEDEVQRLDEQMKTLEAALSSRTSR